VNKLLDKTNMQNINSNETLNYIQPNILTCKSFQTLIDPVFKYSNRIEKFCFEDLFSIKKAFVIAEPGYGKTRLLKEVIIKEPINGKQGIAIDLKKVDKNLKEFIEEKSSRDTLLKTNNFSLINNQRTIVCLDALDEVKQQDFSKIVDWIKEFTHDYPDVNLLISCRLHYFKKYQELFIDTDFEYITIEQFSVYQTENYLHNTGISELDIEKIMEMFRFTDRDLLIQIPRYLEMLTEAIHKKGIDYVKTLTKTDLFELFIYNKLMLEEKKINEQNKEILKRILEKLALLMEIYQTNVITKDELMTFFDDVKSDLKISFLQQVPLEIFYDRSLLKDNIDSVEFENTEFQEYLAAKEILRLGRVEQCIFDLAVDQQLQAIFPSWFNTLSFVVDLDISLLEPLLFFGQSKNRILQDEEYHRFLTKTDTNRLSIEDRKQIFQYVFNYYQTALHWIKFDIAKNLSFYFDVSQINLLKESIDEKEIEEDAVFVRKGNVAEIISCLLERDILNQVEKKYWKNKLIEFAKDKNKNGVLQRNALEALGHFKDIQLMKEVSFLFKDQNELVAQEFLSSCLKVNPNDQFSINILVEAIKVEAIKKDIIALNHYHLKKIKEKNAITYLLNFFIEDEKFLLSFIDQREIYKHIDMVQNIKNVWNSEIQTKIEEIIKTVFISEYHYLAVSSGFIKGLILLLKEKNQDYIFTLLADIKKIPKLQKYLARFKYVFSLILEKDQISKFILELKDLEGGDKIALWTLQAIQSTKREQAEEIYEEGRKYFQKEYEEIEDHIRKQANQKTEEENIYKEFQYRLEPQKGEFQISVFEYYLENKKIIESFIQSNEKERLKQLVLYVLNVTNPDEAKLVITKHNNNVRSYETHILIHFFGLCLKLAQNLNIDLSFYRKKIISYIPFAFYNDLLTIFSIISNPTKDELNSLLEVYTKERNDDLIKFKPDSFIRVSMKYKIVEAIPVLKGFVEEAEFSLDERESALEAISSIYPEQEYLNLIFKKYINKNDATKQIAEDANKYLIEKFQDNKAIEWRLQQLYDRAFPFIEETKINWVGPQEHELNYKDFARPIMNIKNPKYENQYLMLLDKSFQILHNGDDYWAYTTYLWEIVYAYFNNLKELRSYTYLRNLENYVNNNFSQKGVNWFTKRIEKLKRVYLNYIGKPQNIAECIKKYNRLKETQYLEVATSRDLFEVIKEIIKHELRNWIEAEGAYKYIQQATGMQETLIQKTIKTQFENCLLKRGFRKNEVNIRREDQLLDDKRTDFLISYGFIGPILIEIKRVDNDEIVNESERKEYRKKLLHYIEGTTSDFGIFLILQINNKKRLEDYLPKIKDIYKDCTNIEIIGLNCLKAFDEK